MNWQLVKRAGKDFKTALRPRRLDEAAPTFPKQRLQKICRDGVPGQVYLFEGPTGTGKTTCARIVAHAAVCEDEDPKNRPCLKDTCQGCGSYITGHPDLVEINAAHFRKVEDARELVSQLRLRPFGLRKKVYILDEVHQLTKDAQQVLLKELEEPPDHVLFFLCTTETKGLSKTLVDRALTVRFRTLALEDAKLVLKQVLSLQDAELDPSTWPEIIESAQGSVRALLNSLEAALEGDFDAQAWHEEGAEDVPKLAKALMQRDWGLTRKILATVENARAEALRIGVESYLRAVMLKKPTAQDALEAGYPLKYLTGSLGNEVKVSQLNILAYRCLQICYPKRSTT